MRYLPAATRIVAGATTATVSHQFVDADGEPADPAGTVTVSVTRSNGDAVTVSAVTGSGTAARTATIAGAELANVDRFSVVWSIDGITNATDTVDVVGGTIGNAATIAAAEPSLSTETAAAIQSARAAVEDRFAAVLGRSLVPRLIVERFDGTGNTCLTGAQWPDLLEVVWARIWTSATAYTDLTATEAAAVLPDVYSQFQRSDSKAWPAGRRNVEVGYRFGLETLPTDLRDACFAAVRAQIVRTNTGLPDRAVGFGSLDGLNFQIATPGQRGAIWGIPEIDAVWNRYADPRAKIG